MIDNTVRDYYADVAIHDVRPSHYYYVLLDMTNLKSYTFFGLNLIIHMKSPKKNLHELRRFPRFKHLLSEQQK